MAGDEEEGTRRPDDPFEDVDREEAAPEGFAYSASRLETTACLFRFYAKYLAKLPESSSPILAFGSFAHRVIERYVRKCVSAKVDAEGLYASEAIEEVWQEMPGIPPELYEEVFDLVHRFAQRYAVQWDRVVDAELEWAVDARWQPCEWRAPGVKWRGRVDLLEVVEAEAIVTDWKCVLPEQEIRRADGTSVRADTVAVGDAMLAWGGAAPTVDHIVDLWPGGTQPCVGVMTTYGRVFKVSANHPVLVGDRWIEAGKLRPGDPLTVATQAPVVSSIAVGEARLLGYLVADGGLTQGYANFQNKVPAIIDDVTEIAMALGFHVTANPHQDGGIKLGIAGASSWLRSHGLYRCRSADKRVPPAVMRSASDATVAFLSAYFDCDGHVHRTRNDLCSVTVSEGLAADLQELWWRLGARVNVWKQANKEYAGTPYNVWWVKSARRTIVRRMLEILSLRTPENIARAAAMEARVRGPQRVSGGIAWSDKREPVEAVANIERLGSWPTIGIEMAKHQTFVTSGIVTHNTHRHAMGQRQMEQQRSPAIYALLALAHNPSLRRVWMVFDFVRHNIRRTIKFELADLERARERLEREATRMDALVQANRDKPEAWPAMPSPMCGICDYVALCPKRAEVEAIGAVTSPELAVQAGEAVLYLEEALDRARSMLREWVKATGSVKVGSVVFDYRRTAKWEIDAKAVMELCRRHGVPIEAVVRPDKKALDRVAKVSRDFATGLAPLLRDVGATKFDWKKEGAEESQ